MVPGTWTPPQPCPSVQWTNDCNPRPFLRALGRRSRARSKGGTRSQTPMPGTRCCVIFDTGGVETVLGPTARSRRQRDFLRRMERPRSQVRPCRANVDGHPWAVARNWSHDRRHHVQVSVEALQQHRRWTWQDVHPAELVAHLCTAGADVGHTMQVWVTRPMWWAGPGRSEEGDVRGHAAELRAARGQPLRAGRKQQARRRGWRPGWRAG